jgi:hypothetical protein
MAVQKSGTPGSGGSLTHQEIRPLVIQARQAFEHQASLGRVEPGTTFDDWRHDQVMDAVGRAGISKVVRDEWRRVMARFLTLSGKDDQAFELLLKTGPKTTRPAESADTWETSETYVALIRQALADHATFPAELISDFGVNGGHGHIHAGWLLAAARQRSKKPTLTMDTLAERLDPATLHGLLSHLRNHISLREGRADLDRRKTRRYPKPADPGILSAPF